MGQAVISVSIAEELAPVAAKLDGLEVRIGALETAQSSERVCYTVTEVAELTGLSTTQIYKFMKRGDLPAKKAGGCVRIVRSDLITWLNRLPDYVTYG